MTNGPISGGRYWIRTSGLRLRRPTLYPFPIASLARVPRGSRNREVAGDHTSKCPKEGERSRPSEKSSETLWHGRFLVREAATRLRPGCQQPLVAKNSSEATMSQSRPPSRASGRPATPPKPRRCHRSRRFRSNCRRERARDVPWRAESTPRLVRKAIPVRRPPARLDEMAEGIAM
jgi:hypothetical protein